MEIEVEDLTKSYEGETVLDSLSWTIRGQRITTVLAPTGAGKTTLLRLLAGIEFPDSGRIYYDGKDVTDLDVRERDVGFVYQKFVNFPNLTVFENIASPLRVSGEYSEEKIEEEVRRHASLLNVEDLLDRNVDQLSGGEKQRTAIARTLAKGSEVIFLDEPLANLDYKLREKLREELREIFEEKGGTVVYASPEPIDALAISDDLGFLRNGKIEDSGPVEKVYNRPATSEVASYFSTPSMNILQAEFVEDGEPHFEITEELKVSTANMKESLSEGEYLFGIRAHDLQSSTEGGEATKVTGEVEATDVRGNETTVRIRSHGQVLRALLPYPEYYDIGEEIEMFLNVKNEFYVFDKETEKLITVFEGGKYGGD